MSAEVLRIPVVNCDGCEKQEEGHAGQTVAELRGYLKKIGWSRSQTRDLCQECQRVKPRMTLDEILDAAPTKFRKREKVVPSKAQLAEEARTLTAAQNAALAVIDRCAQGIAVVSNRTAWDREDLWYGGPSVSAGAAKKLVELGICEVTCETIYGATSTGGYARDMKMGEIRRVAP